MIEGRLVERVPFLFHPEMDFGDDRLKHIAPFDKAAANGCGIGAAGGEEVGRLLIGLRDARVTGTAGSGPYHQGQLEDYHTRRSFKPICRAPCLSGL